MAISAKITKKGQVTIPKQVRDILDSDVIEFEVSGGNVLIRPVNSVAGSLSKYARGKKEFQEIRETVWDEVAREKGK